MKISGSDAARVLGSLRTEEGRKRAGRKKVIRTCPKCGGSFGARELREHLPVCAGAKAGKKKKR